MTNETRRRQMREQLIAKARQMQEADRSRRIKVIEKFTESRRSLKGPYSPERCKAQLRDLFGDKHRNAMLNREH